MNTLNKTLDLSINFGYIWPVIAFTISLIVSYLSHPVILKVSRIKNLMPNPNHRSVHSKKISNLGGIGIFLAINVVITLLGNYFDDQNLLSLLGAMTIMFFVGLVDDLININPKSKLAGQFIASLYIILSTNLRIENLHGLLGLYELPYLFSVLLTVFVFIALINAYNLIDGVDGLAGSIAIVVAGYFGSIFYLNNNYSMFLVSISIIGAVISFLVFNFSKKNKIFMGDTGAMVIGFLLAYLAVNFMSENFSSSAIMFNSKTVIYFLAIFSFPLVDTFRVFFVRIKSGKNPFEADKNHMHHILLNAGLKHWQIAVVASVFSVAVVSSMYVFNELDVNKLLLVLGVMWSFTILIVGNLNNIKLLSSRNTNKESVLRESLELTDFNKRGKVLYMKKLA